MQKAKPTQVNFQFELGQEVYFTLDTGGIAKGIIRERIYEEEHHYQSFGCYKTWAKEPTYVLEYKIGIQHGKARRGENSITNEPKF